jgi:hypothetical protein
MSQRRDDRAPRSRRHRDWDEAAERGGNRRMAEEVCGTPPRPTRSEYRSSRRPVPPPSVAPILATRQRAYVLGPSLADVADGRRTKAISHNGATKTTPAESKALPASAAPNPQGILLNDVNRLHTCLYRSPVFVPT